MGREMLNHKNRHAFDPVTRRLRLNGQSTSIRLEQVFWDGLDRMALAQGVPTPAYLSKLQSDILEQYGEVPNFASYLRCVCVLFLDDPLANGVENLTGPMKNAVQ
jgi:predicted DNA-binding ribbon-helix-helix protein